MSHLCGWCRKPSGEAWFCSHECEQAYLSYKKETKLDPSIETEIYGMLEERGWPKFLNVRWFTSDVIERMNAIGGVRNLTLREIKVQIRRILRISKRLRWNYNSVKNNKRVFYRYDVIPDIQAALDTEVHIDDF